MFVVEQFAKMFSFLFFLLKLKFIIEE